MFLKTKGKAEEAVKALEFNRTSIYRPGLLMCDREEPRFGEKVAKITLNIILDVFSTFVSYVKVARCVAGALDKSANRFSIGTDLLAKVMVHNSLREDFSDKVETLEHKDIVKMGKEL